MLGKRFLGKQVLTAAALAAIVGISAHGHAQNFAPQMTQRGFFGGVNNNSRGGFDLSQQATQRPVFADRQGNDYASMSPDSWSHPATQQSTHQQSAAYNNIGLAPTPVRPAGPTQQRGYVQRPNRYPLDQLRSSSTPRVAEASALPPLTNTQGARPIRFAETGTNLATQIQRNTFRNASLSNGTATENRNDDVPFPFTRRQRTSSFQPADTNAVDGDFNQLDDDYLDAPAELNPLNADIPDLNALESDAGDARETPMVKDLPPLDSATNGQSAIGNNPNNIGNNTEAIHETEGVLSAPDQSYATAADHGALHSNSTQPIMTPQQLPQLALPAMGIIPGQTTAPMGYQQSNMNQRSFVSDWPSPMQPSFQTADRPINFRPDLGQRNVWPTRRVPHLYDDGEKFDHETKKTDYPPFKEIINTGRFFYNAEVAALRPHFLGNTGNSVNTPTFSESQSFDFDTNYAPSFKAGFESQYGPGVELAYFNMIGDGEVLSSVSDGVSSVVSSVGLSEPGRFSSIAAVNAGESLVANHSINLETFGLNFFKELKFPISRLNGKFGFMYANVAQTFNVDRRDSSGNQLGTLQHTTDFRGYGPQFALEYFRPVGHTPMTLVTSFGGKGLFGRRDQFVNNTDDVVARRFGADEFITVIDFTGGVQFKKMIADQRYLTARIGYMHQSWLGGGTAVDAQGDFGFSGLMFGIGLNR